jgi:phage terminase large subunit-like protein
MSPSGFLRQKFSGYSSRHTSLREMARQRLSLLDEQGRQNQSIEPLMEFIPRVTPRWESPLHLKPYIDILETAPHGNKRIVFAAPPQHGKTESTVHAFAWWLLKYPTLRYVYATYAAHRAQRVGRRARDLIDRAHVPLKVANLDMWATQAGGQVLWSSVGGGLTGEAVDGVIVIDDPLKDRADAESITVREGHKDWFHGVVEARVHPGASIIVMATRWHSDDLSGYLVREQGFEYINLRAICEADDKPEGDMRQEGEALWEAHRPLAMLQQRRDANPWNFASIYQGNPRPRGNSLFNDPHHYAELPERGFRVVFGVDLAYTARTHADWSVCVELWVVPPKSVKGQVFEPKDYLFYVVDVVRKQVEAPNFTLTLKAKKSERSGAVFYWYASGTEAGSAQFIQKQGIPLRVMSPGGRDKFTRAQQSSELWNLGRVLVPMDSERYPWVDVFVDEMCSFSGVGDVCDDQVDALVSAIDAALTHQDTLGILGSGGRYK